jgi:predicted GIY-YIG superfamily endonuclease
MNKIKMEGDVIDLPTKSERAGVYLLTIPGKDNFYIGSSEDVYARTHQHERLLRSGKHELGDLQEAFNQVKAVEFKAIKTKDKEEALKIEQRLLDQNLSNPFCSNTADNAKRALASSAVQEYLRKPKSEDTKKRMSESKLGVQRTDEVREILKKNGAARAKPVEVDGVVFESKSAAARHYGLAVPAVNVRIASRSPKFANWKTIEK